VPSFDVLVYSDLGVSGSMRPDLTFFSKGILSDKQSTALEQPVTSFGATAFLTAVL
jgi:hypothetical protein